MSTVSNIQSQIATIQRELAILNGQLISASQANDSNRITQITQEIDSKQAQLSSLFTQLSVAQAENAVPTDSAGQVTNDDGTANSQNPSTAPTTVTTGADGRIDPANVESGTNAPVRTLQQTQGTPQAQPVYTEAQVNQNLTNSVDQTGLNAPPPITSAGVGAGNDDTATPTKNATKQEIDNVFGSAGPLVPQPNVLDQYASYSYQASVYLMKPEAFAAMVRSKKKSIAGSQLLFQSGGAPVAGRNPYFTNDYYIDRFELKSAITGKGTGAAHNANTIKMTVVEPNGITLIENLDKAVQSYLGTTGTPPKKKNFQAQLYLLVVRFYGYDDSGKLVQAGVNTTQGSTPTTPGAAFVEKYYPFALNTIKFKIANKLVEYEIEGVAIQYQINTGQLRAVVPYNIELSSSTLSDAFNGAAVVGSTTTTATTTIPTTAASPASVLAAANAQDAARDQENSSNPQTIVSTAPQKANSAPTAKLTVRQGIVQAMNQYQLDKVKNKEITYPDVYSVEFVTDAVAQAKIKRVGQAKKADPMPTGGTAAQQKLPEKQSLDDTTRLLSITAGQPMVQVIDQLLKNSSYIEDQQLVKVLEESGIQQPNGAAGANLAWYKISMQATPGQFDPLRNDYAYNIKYIIHPYKINDMISNYFTSPKYNGVHKQYNHWFTGLNTQILNYEQNYNSLYTQVLSGGPPNKNAATQSDVKMTPSTRSGQSSQGAQGRANEPAANAADYLYSPGDNNDVVVSIVGDPAWLQQGEATFGVDAKNFNFKGFLPDGTINYDSQQILFEVLFNTPTDYNLSTGLMDPNVPSSTTNASTTATSQPGANRKSFIFLAKEVVSEFIKGKFVQTLKGVKVNYFGDQAQKAGALARPVTASTTPQIRSLTSADPANPSAVPTSSPQVPTQVETSTVPPTSSAQPITSADGTVIQYPPAPDTAVSPVVTEAPPQPLPTSVPTPATTNGVTYVNTTNASTPALGTQPGDTNLVRYTDTGAFTANGIPAPKILPRDPTLIVYGDNVNNSQQTQVNTTPPQLIDKSDQ